MKRLVLLLCWVISLQVGATLISQEIAVERAQVWMGGNPVMGAVEHSVASVEMFPGTGGYSVYVVHLSPTGYLILNSDDRLPLVVSFSTESSVDLSDFPQNAFRAMLLRHVERMAQELAQPPSAIQADAVLAPLAVTELYGPFLETTWSQCNPYNKLCPDDPAGSDYYAQRAPVGCVPTAYAQILNFHRWPVFGEGSHSYTDSWGSITGAHSADFSDTYDWAFMLSAYDAWNPNPLAAEDAVAELMYELGVAAEADYENSGTSSSTSTLGHRLGEYFFFESCEWQSDQSSLISPMEADLRAGFPCIVTIPGHAIVADGLMVDDGTTTYHINYGWGGSNNGWWSKDNVAGDALEDGATSLKPRLMAFPKTNTVVGVMGESVELQWVLPKRREAEVSELAIHRLEQQAGNWSSDASEITGMNSGWEVVSAGYSGDCWFTGPSGPASMILDEVFVPDASAELTFWKYVRLYTSTFAVEASTDGGATYSTLFSTAHEDYDYSWSQESISLAAYAGQQIRLRFALSSGGWYTNGGIWLDDLAMTSGDWLSWQPFAVDDTLASRRFSAVTTELDDCDDFSGFEITSTSTYKDWVVSTTSGVANCFYKQPGGYGNREYHLTSLSTITPTASTRLLLRAKYRLSTDGFRVLLSTDRNSFTEIWSGSGTVDWSDIAIDLSAYAGQAVYVRLEYLTGGYYSDGGIWIDTVSTQEITNPELEGQPVHYTLLTNLPAGTHTLAAVLTDTSAEEHGLAPTFTLTVETDDIDDDGLPNDWETQYYGGPTNANPAATCSNGIDSVMDAYIAGFDPTDPDALFLMTGMTDGSVIHWDSVSGRLYSVYWCADLLEGFDATPFASNLTSGAFTDTVHGANSEGFYQLEVELAP